MATRRGNREGSITKLAENKYMGKIMIGWNIDGTPNRKSVYGRTRKEVSDKLIVLASKVIDGTYLEPTKLTLGMWLLRWLKDYKSINIKPRTYDTYESQINANIVPEIGYIELKDLKPAIFQKFYNKQYDGGKGLSPATIRKIHSIIQAALKQARINRLLSGDPQEGVELPVLFQKEIRAFTPEEQDKFFQAAKGSSCYNAFLMIVDTGLRMTELLALVWDDINFKDGSVSVSRNISQVKDRGCKSRIHYKLIVQNTPKTKASIRKIPLTQRVLKMLKEMSLQSNPEINLVFPSRNGTHINPRNFERTFQNIVRKANIELCNTHTLRHTFATRCFEKGIQVKIVSKWLGHSKTSHTLDIYTHVMPDLDKHAIKMLETPVNEEFPTAEEKPNYNPIVTQNR